MTRILERTFEGFNPVGDPCPVCRTKDDRETVLVPIKGTEHDGLCRAAQVHADCYARIEELVEGVT